MKEGWEYKIFESCLVKVPRQVQLKSKDYKKEGKFPIVSQEAELISGYWDDETIVYKHKEPVVIFGDHTKNIKYIDFDFVVGADGTHILSIKKDINPKFFYYVLKSIKLRELGYARHYKLLKEKYIPVPPLSEQQSIVDYLDSAFAKIDAMKANAEKALNEAKALFQASLKEMLEPKEGWEEKKLQEVACDFSRGKSKHRPRNDKKLFGGKYPFIQTGEIRNSNVYVTSHSSTYNDFGLSQSKLWPEDTVCITIAANIAEVAILKYPCCFPDSVIGFVADNNKVDKMFVFYSLLNYQQELKKQSKGSAQDNINLGTFENNKFPFPSLQEQQSIITTLNSLKSKVDKLQENYDKISQECDALKQAILRQVFE